MSKVLCAISTLGLISSLIFTIVSIWNNGADWLLLEKGYYTFGVSTVAFSLIMATKSIIDRMELNRVGIADSLASLVSIGFSGVALLFMIVSVRNTEWVLMEKGYYWMGLMFISVTAVMFWATLHMVLKEIDNPKETSGLH